MKQYAESSPLTNSRAYRPERFGFSLLELLIVITIIVIMASLMGPTLNTALRGTALTQATDKVIGVLSLAHQTAITKAQTVEVRFYSYTNLETPGDTGQGHALQAFSYDDSTGIFTPLMKAQILPNSVVLTTNTNFSSLMTLTNTTASNNYAIPRVSNNYTCSSFQYFRSGSTSLVASPINTNACITLLNLTDVLNTNSSSATTLPINYATVVIDPYNGSLKTFRPHL